MGTALLHGLRDWWRAMPLALGWGGREFIHPTVLDARAEFLAMLADLHGADTLHLRERIQRACSLRELWHLRADVFRVVAVQHNQAVAEDRLLWLARFFPIRSPRSAFGGLPPVRDTR
jgi:hypothetical protein